MGDKPVHVLIIDANRIRASIIEEGLVENGVTHVTVLTDMRELLRKIIEIDPDVIFVDLENPNRDQLEYILQVPRAVKRPVAMFVEHSDQASTEAAIDAGVSAYIVDGLRKERVRSILDMTVSRFNAFHRLQKELDSVRNELAERKTIDRAKAILMKTRGVNEPEAYALLRRIAMNEGRRIAVVAESVVLAAGLFKRDVDT